MFKQIFYRKVILLAWVGGFGFSFSSPSFAADIKCERALEQRPGFFKHLFSNKMTKLKVLHDKALEDERYLSEFKNAFVDSLHYRILRPEPASLSLLPSFVRLQVKYDSNLFLPELMKKNAMLITDQIQIAEELYQIWLSHEKIRHVVSEIMLKCVSLNPTEAHLWISKIIHDDDSYAESKVQFLFDAVLSEISFEGLLISTLRNAADPKFYNAFSGLGDAVEAVKNFSKEKSTENITSLGEVRSWLDRLHAFEARARSQTTFSEKFFRALNQLKITEALLVEAKKNRPLVPITSKASTLFFKGPKPTSTSNKSDLMVFYNEYSGIGIVMSKNGQSHYELDAMISLLSENASNLGGFTNMEDLTHYLDSAIYGLYLRNFHEHFNFVSESAPVDPKKEILN